MFIKKRKKDQIQERELAPTNAQQNLVFQNSAIFDVTNFDAMTPDEPMGYFCGGIIQLFSDGGIIISSEEEKDILESFHLTDVIRRSDNINSFDPFYKTAVSLTTSEKDIRISFQSIEIKRDFWNTAITVYDNIK